MNLQAATLDSEDVPTNLSANPEFQTVVASAVSRRGSPTAHREAETAKAHRG